MSNVQEILVETSPLISFLKASRFDLLEILGKPLRCTAQVHEEIHYFPQRGMLEMLVAENRISVVDLEVIEDITEFDRLTKPPFPYGPGEVSSILYASRAQATLIITDNKGIREAKKRSVSIMTTQDVLLFAINQGHMTADEADDLLRLWETLNEFPVNVKSFKDIL